MGQHTFLVCVAGLPLFSVATLHTRWLLGKPLNNTIIWWLHPYLRFVNSWFFKIQFQFQLNSQTLNRILLSKHHMGNPWLFDVTGTICKGYILVSAPELLCHAHISWLVCFKCFIILLCQRCGQGFHNHHNFYNMAVNFTGSWPGLWQEHWPCQNGPWQGCQSYLQLWPHSS